jgi:hypothetical protein
LVHDVSCFNFGGFGIYAEGGGCNLTFSDNVIYATRGGVFAPHPLTRDARLVNNVLVSEGDGGYPSFGGVVASFGGYTRATLERNIFVLRRGELFTGRWSNYTEHKHGRNITANISWAGCDRNLYFSPSGLSLRFPDAQGQPSGFDAWRSEGHDLRGAAGVDPGFVDAAARDYRLRPGGGASRLGIESIDLSGAGPTGVATVDG